MTLAHGSGPWLDSSTAMAGYGKVCLDMYFKTINQALLNSMRHDQGQYIYLECILSNWVYLVWDIWGCVGTSNWITHTWQNIWCLSFTKLGICILTLVSLKYLPFNKGFVMTIYWFWPSTFLVAGLVGIKGRCTQLDMIEVILMHLLNWIYS